MGSFSIGHWLVVLLVLALVFGPKRLAELGGGLGKGIRAFKDGASGPGDEGTDKNPKEIAGETKSS